MKTLPRHFINGAEIAYETVGSGEDVLLLHCGFIADSFAPLRNEPSLTQKFHLINYHRRGYGQSAPVAPPYSMEQQANDALELLRKLGIQSAHIVGHSFGANVAIQFALNAPEVVRSLTLIEPLLGFFLSQASLEFLMATIGQAMQAFARGNTQEALDTWLNGAFGLGWQKLVNSRLPGAYAQAVHDVTTAIAVEAASTQSWEVNPQHLSRIEQPVLSVTHNNPGWRGFDEMHQGLLATIPNAEPYVIPESSHLMQMQSPHAVAIGLADFLARNPIRLAV